MHQDVDDDAVFDLRTGRGTRELALDELYRDIPALGDGMLPLSGLRPGVFRAEPPGPPGTLSPVEYEMAYDDRRVPPLVRMHFRADRLVAAGDVRMAALRAGSSKRTV